MAPPKRGSTLRAQWLGQLLRRARESAKVPAREAARYLQHDASTISRIEAGITPARVGDVWALMNLYGVEDRLRPAFEQLSREIWYKGWWEGYADAIAESFIDHAWLEARAERIRSFDAVSLPGLFQTEAYATALIEANDPETPRDQIERWVAYRIDRQQILTAENPPQVTAILDEAVLRRRVGGSSTMREQLKKLLSLGEKPNIDIRVLPFDAGAHASPDGPFTVIELPDPFPPVACVQSPAGVTYLEEERAVNLVAAIGRLDKVALGPDASMDIISSMVRTAV